MISVTPEDSKPGIVPLALSNSLGQIIAVTSSRWSCKRQLEETVVTVASLVMSQTFSGHDENDWRRSSIDFVLQTMNQQQVVGTSWGVKRAPARLTKCVQTLFPELYINYYDTFGQRTFGLLIGIISLLPFVYTQFDQSVMPTPQ